MIPHTWAKGGVHFFGLRRFRRSNCFIRIRDTIFSYEFIQTNSYNCYTNCIVQIWTRCSFCTNSCIFYTNCIVRIHKTKSADKIWPNGGSIRATRSTFGVEIRIFLVWDRCQQWRNFTRKFGVTSVGWHVGLVLRGCVLDACLARSMRTCTGARVCAWTPALISPQLLDLLRLTVVTDHE